MLTLLKRIRSMSRPGVLLALMIVMGVLFVAVPLPAYALGAKEIVIFFADILFTVVMWPFIQLLNLMIVVLLKIAAYNNFAGAAVVQVGWGVTRDVSNMFFVLILLIIAIGTIVKWEAINYRSSLRRLIIMALLINFSKTIVVFLIDFSQVIMLTFLSAIRNVLQAGIISALHLDEVINKVSGGASEVAFGVLIYIVAAIMVVVACIVVIAIALIFLVRIIALWMVIVFAPLAFLASTLPQTKEWYDKWWKIFGANLTVGPALAFMLWLVFSVISQTSSGSGTDTLIGEIQKGSGTIQAVESGGVGSEDVIAYMIVIGLMIYSVRLAVQMGAAGAKVADGFQNKMGGYARSGAKRIWTGKSGVGGLYGRGMTLASGVGAGATSMLGLSRLTENIRADQYDRMEKRAEAKRPLLRHLSEAKLERRATAMTTSYPERAEIRKEQMRRGHFEEGTDERGFYREARSDAEMKKIGRQIEMGSIERGILGKTAGSANREFMRKEADTRMLSDTGYGVPAFGRISTDEAERRKQSIIMERIRSGHNFTGEELKDKFTQRGLTATKSVREIQAILKDKGDDVEEAWVEYIDDRFHDIAQRPILNKDGTVNESPTTKQKKAKMNDKDNVEAQKLRKLLPAVSGQTVMRASSYAKEDKKTGRIVLSEPDYHSDIDPRVALNNTIYVTAQSLSKTPERQRRLTGQYLSANDVNRLARDENMTQQKLDEVFESIANPAKNKGRDKYKDSKGKDWDEELKDIVKERVDTADINLYNRPSVIREDYRRIRGTPPPGTKKPGGGGTPGGAGRGGGTPGGAGGGGGTPGLVDEHGNPIGDDHPYRGS